MPARYPLSFILTLLAGMALPLSAQATGPDSLPGAQTLPATLGSPVVVLDRPRAEQLLASTEGPAWRVFAVAAPACVPSKARAAKTAPARKQYRKSCKAQKAACTAASQFAKAHDGLIVCSALYHTTTVLLTNAPKPAP